MRTDPSYHPAAAACAAIHIILQLTNKYSIGGTTLSTDSVDAEWKICLKRTFYVSCLFINNMSSTRFYSIYNQCCYVFARSTLCLVLKSTHGLWQSWFILTGFLCWNMQIFMPLISSRIKLLPNESFIRRRRFPRKWPQQASSSVCSVLYILSDEWNIELPDKLFHNLLCWALQRGIFPCYFESFNRKELARDHLCI